MDSIYSGCWSYPSSNRPRRTEEVDRFAHLRKQLSFCHSRQRHAQCSVRSCAKSLVDGRFWIRGSNAQLHDSAFCIRRFCIGDAHDAIAPTVAGQATLAQLRDMKISSTQSRSPPILPVQFCIFENLSSILGTSISC